jgi:hypothetical protein
MVRNRPARAIGRALVALVVVASTGCGGGLVQQYEYDEEIYLSVDGSATVSVNASIPSLVNLRGMDLDTSPTAKFDRAKIRTLFSSPVARVTRINTWRRAGRRFVQVRLDVDDIRKLGTAPPFAWAGYQLDLKDDQLVYRETVGAAAGKNAGQVGWDGQEMVAFRLHLPSKIRYHNAGPANFRRGNILVWEQALADRQAGKPLEMEARIEKVSILYRTLWLFGVSGLLAIAVLAAIIWWVMRKPAAAAGATGG